MRAVDDGGLPNRALLQEARGKASALTGGPRDYDSLIEAAGEARFVLLGEASHGTHEFYRERARITRRLIEEKGLTDAGRRGRGSRSGLGGRPSNDRPIPHGGPSGDRGRDGARVKEAAMAGERNSGENGRLVRVPAAPVVLEGNLALPGDALGVVLFAHGSGSSRFSPRNRAVAKALRGEGLATLLIDLLTPEEEAEDNETARLRFDIDLLAERLVGATDWLAEQPETGKLRIGYFGASTGAGAALVAAAQRPNIVRAVVSRGGRPDLAGSALARVRVPTLLIVGGNDLPVIDMNREAMARMQAKKRLEIIPGATHLFEEPGTLEQVARLAAEWFRTWLAPSGKAGLREASSGGAILDNPEA